MSSVPRHVGDVSQTIADIGENDPIVYPQKLHVQHTMQARILSLIIPKAQNSAKQDFWSPTGLAMGVGENLGQIVVSGGLVGGAGKAATLAAKGSKLAGLGAAADRRSRIGLRSRLWPRQRERIRANQ